MSFDIEHIEIWIASITSGLALIGILFGNRARNLLISLFRSPFEYFGKMFSNKEIDKKLDDIMKELKPNGGSTLRDAITRLESQQSQLTAKFIAILDQPTNQPVFETDASGKYIWVSTSYMNMTGRSFDELRGYGWTNAIHPDDLEAVREEWELAISQCRVFEHAHRFKHINGTITKTECKAVPTTVNGAVVGWMGFIYIVQPKKKVLAQ